MTTAFDRYAIERTMRAYSNDLLSAFHGPIQRDASVQKNEIARAQSMLADIDYINAVAAEIRAQVRDCQKQLKEASCAPQ